MKNILFVSHDASRTGAPIVLLKFLQWLIKSKKYNFSILIKYSGGVLTNDFSNIAPTYQLETKHSLLNRVKAKVFRLIFKKNINDTMELASELKKQKFDLIYLNTVLSLDLAYFLKSHFNCPVITHIHENEYAVKLLYPDGINQIDIDSVEKFIAVSKSTEKNLVENCNIPDDKIKLIYPFTSVEDLRKITKTKQEVITELDLENDFIVGAAGDCNWRKGVDLFIRLAVFLNKAHQNKKIKLLWIGNFTYDFKCQIEYELKRLNIANKIIFTGSKPDPQNYFQLFDVFALTSREDPFPLVALEAASMGKPVVFFDEVGGMSELFVNNKGGIKVAYGNVPEMSEAIIHLFNNPEVKTQKSEEAKSLIKDYDIDIICSQITSAMNDAIN